MAGALRDRARRSGAGEQATEVAQGEVASRPCRRCGESCPEGDFYRHGPRTSNICKPCERRAARARHAKDPAAHRTYQRTYERTNPERARGAKQRWYYRNREAFLARQRAMRREERRAYSIQYRIAHREECLARTSDWRRRNPVLVAEGKARHRARLLGATVERVSREEIIQRDESTCYLCHRRLAWGEITLDHVIPLSRGGAHEAGNLRVACRPCNSRKRDTLPVAA